MKTNIKLIYYCLLSMLTLFSYGCSKEIPEPVTFSLNVSNDYTFSAKKSLMVSFACDNAVYPEVSINGHQLEKLFISGSIVSGNMIIPYSDTIHFEVKSRQKKTTGTLLTPPYVKNMKCNGISISKGGNISYRSDISDYILVWDRVQCDYYTLETNMLTPDRWVLLENNQTDYSFSDIIKYNCNIVFSTVNGDVVSPGKKPSFIGDFGVGFCSVRIYSRYYIISGTKSAQNVDINDLTENMDLIHKNHLISFSEYITFNK